jgi:type VI secretion system secreted protein Hcp
MAQVDYFLKLDGITGESTALAFEGQIDIESFSWGISNSARAVGSAAGGAGAGKVTFQDLHLTSSVSKASPQLMLACANGHHLKDATLTGILNGKSQQDFFTIKMTEVVVSSYQTGGSGESPEDQFTLNFAKVEVDYKPQAETGLLLEPVVGAWNLSTGLKG